MASSSSEVFARVDEPHIVGIFALIKHEDAGRDARRVK